MSIDRPRVEAAVRELIRAIGEDPDRKGLRGTPACVAGAYVEFFAGLDKDPLDLLRDALPAGHKNSEVVFLRDIAFRSMCEHHLLPFLGTAHVGYLPGDRVIGLGTITRVVDVLASRPQIQERLTEEIADALAEGLEPRGALIVIEARHGCVSTRGARVSGMTTVTVASRGELREPTARAELMMLLGAREDVRS